VRYEEVFTGAQTRWPDLNLLMADDTAKRLRCVPVWRLDRLERSLVDCLNNTQTLAAYGRFNSATQTLDTDLQNPTSRLLRLVLVPRRNLGGADPGEVACWPGTIRQGFRGGPGGQDGSQSVRECPGSPSTEKGLRPGGGDHHASPGPSLGGRLPCAWASDWKR
jgi:hypothetical protein